MKKFQTVIIITQEPTPKPNDTTRLMQEAILLTISNIKDKIKNCDNPKDVSYYVDNIKTLTESYKILIS